MSGRISQIMFFTQKRKDVFICLLALITVIMTPAGAMAKEAPVTRRQAIDWARKQSENPKDYDGGYGVQCVDLAVAYYRLLGEKSPGGNGKDYAENALPQGWKRIAFNNKNIPLPGDIAVWTKTNSNYGHVAIVLYADAKSLTVSEFLGSNHQARIHTYSYSFGTFFGVIRPVFSPDPLLSVFERSNFPKLIINYLKDKAAGQTVENRISGQIRNNDFHCISK